MYIHNVLTALLLTAMVVDVAAQSAPSDNLLNFLTVTSGDYSNQKQLEIDGFTGEHHPPMFVSLVPVEVPALSLSITFLLEEDVNGAVNRLQLLVVSEENGGIIRLQKYNLPGQYSPGTFDLDQLNDLEISDLHTDPKCDVLFEAVEPTVFMGTWPDCKEFGAKDIPPNYVPLWTCKAVAWQSPGGAAEKTVRLPNNFELVKRYPLLPYMVRGRTDFVDPCDNII